MGITAAYIVPHPPLIIPEVGRGEEKKIEKTIASYREVGRRVASHAPDTVVFITPHTVIYRDYFHISPGGNARGDFGQFNAPEAVYTAEYDDDLRTAIIAEAEAAGIPAGTEGERDPELDHATMIPMHFINEFYTDYRSVRVGYSGMPAVIQYMFGKCIKAAAEKTGKNVVIIASGDLSHKLNDESPYGYTPKGEEFDDIVVEAMQSGDFSEFIDMPLDVSLPAAECGLNSFRVMSGALDRLSVEPEFLSHEGPFGVGYAVGCFEVTGEDPSRDFGEGYLESEAGLLSAIRTNESDIVKLARYTVENFVRTGEKPEQPADVPKELRESEAGVFVSLHEFNELRGCIGTFMPTQQCIADEIMENAVSSCSRDPRFAPVAADDLEHLVYSVDILGDLEEVDSADELDPKKYGVFVRSGWRSGILLPDLEGIDTAEQQLRIAKRKGGIGPDEPVTMYRFEVRRYK